jgi:hypothetical protein
MFLTWKRLFAVDDLIERLVSNDWFLPEFCSIIFLVYKRMLAVDDLIEQYVQMNSSNQGSVRVYYSLFGKETNFPLIVGDYALFV